MHFKPEQTVIGNLAMQGRDRAIQTIWKPCTGQLYISVLTNRLFTVTQSDSWSWNVHVSLD